MSKAARNANRKHRLTSGPAVYVGGNQAEKIMRGERIPEPNGQHLWIMAGMWAVDPITALEGASHLDLESLLCLSGPGCYFCEKEYTPEIAKQKCVSVS